MSLTELNKLEKLIIRAVIENTIDQLAIVGGTIQISLPSSSHPSSQVHQNASQRPLEELILKEHRQYQKVYFIIIIFKIICSLKVFIYYPIQGLKG